MHKNAIVGLHQAGFSAFVFPTIYVHTEAGVTTTFFFILEKKQKITTTASVAKFDPMESEILCLFVIFDE